MSAHLIAEEGPLRGLIIDFEEGNEWILGRDPDQADFVLEDSTVSRKHVLCTKTDQGIQIKNLSTVNPCTINDAEITDSYLLKEGDLIRIGQNLFIFSEEKIKSNPKKEKTNNTAFDAIFEEDENDEMPPIGEPLSEEPSKEEEPLEESIEEEISKEDSSDVEEKTAYDTIFEDAEEYEELPFNLIGETSLILKVISGPNAGAEIGIQKGRSYVIGKDPYTSDIVFQDLSVSKNHAKLSVNDEGLIELEDLNSKNGTLVNGSVIDTKIEITSQDLIAMGTTTFLIIDREQEAETIYAPTAEKYEPKKPSTENLQEKESELAYKKDKISWKKQIIPTKHLVIAASFVLVFFVVFLSFFSLFKPEKQITSTKGEEDQIQKITKPFEDVTFSYFSSSGRLLLVGHVLTPVKHQELLFNIEQLSFIESIEDTLVIDEYIWRSMNEVLTENAGFKGVNMHSPKAGKFVVDGYLQTPQQAEELGEYLNMNFLYLDRLTNEVVVESELNTQIAGILQNKGFSGLTFQLTNGQLVLQGRYDEKESKAFESLLNDLRSLKGVHGIKNFAIAASANAARIDISKNFKVTGFAKHNRMNYSVVINGQIVTVGETFEGMEITKILPHSILLEKEGLKYKIDYTR